MKRALLIFLLFFAVKAFAQSGEIDLARQYSSNGEDEKAQEIYQKLYRQNNEIYYNDYLEGLLKLKKYDEAESATKKLLRKHPGTIQYNVALARIYKVSGAKDKAEAVYADILKDLPADYNNIAGLATQFYQGENMDMAVRVFLQGRKVLKNDQAFTMELISLYRFKRDKAAMVNEFLNFLPANPGYISQAENTIATTFEPGDYDMLRTELLKHIQQDPQQLVFPEMLTWQYLQQKDYEQALNQALALSRRRNDGGESIFDLCQTLMANQAYDEAIRGYEYLIGKGSNNPLYLQAKIEQINAKNLKVTADKYTQADLLSLEKDYNDLLTEFGRSSSTVFAMERLALLEAFKLHKLEDAQKLLEDAIKITNVSGNMLAICKLDLGDIYLMTNQPWEATLLYSQVEKSNNDNLGQDAKLRNAKLAYYTGDFKWAKGQLDVLKAATSQLIANDALNLSLLISDNTAGADSAGLALKMYARADLLIFMQQPDKAMMTLDSIDKKYPGNSLVDDILMAKARIYLQQKDYKAAVPNLKTIAEQHQYGLWADDAVFMLGDIYENQLNDKEQAKSYYQKIITDYPGSLYINEARKRFRTLRGDKMNGT
ncbi:tetratricopeptide repeat protein [Mucilaginibacter yixingensis]|nr:tetratricopeptide repeat protein [Mucilaginibacter yixingensis]